MHFDLKFKMKPWKKALAFSFHFYLIVLFILIIIITFIHKDFNFGQVSIVSAGYMIPLILVFHYMFKMF